MGGGGGTGLLFVGRLVAGGAWAERASWACWAAAVGEELGPRGVQLGQGFGLGFPGKVGLGLG